MYKKINIHPFNLESRIKLLQEKVTHKQDYDLILEHLKLLRNGEITGKSIGEARERKLIDMFSIFFKNYKKTFSKITYDDLSKFKEKLMNNKILKNNGEPYAEKTKEDLVETIGRFIEITFPEKIPSLKGKILPFRKWFVIRAPKKTPEVLTEAEVEKLLKASKTIEGKFILCVFFSSGCRIEEFLNLRFEDIEEPTQNFPYYRFDFKEEYSKTNGRKIGLYWKDSTAIISKYLSSCEDKEPKNQIFPKEYDAVRMFISRLGKKVLNKKINPHMFRKSSATYYADKLNRQELCVRYGWKFSSAMPDTYISRAGLDENSIKEKIIRTDLGDIQKENKQIKQVLKGIINHMLKENNRSPEDNLKVFYSEYSKLNEEEVNDRMKRAEDRFQKASSKSKQALLSIKEKTGI